MLDEDNPERPIEADASVNQAGNMPSLNEQRQHFISHLPEGEIGIGFDRGFDGKPSGNVSFEDESSVWNRVDQLVAKGHDVFITTAAFANKFGNPRPDGNERYGRTIGNVASIGALPGDIDVDKPGQQTVGYAFRDRDEAREELDRICQREGLPIPSMHISSGRGLHVWWLLAGSLSAAEGKELRQHFYEAMTSIEPRLTVDPSRWKDINGLLRPIGTLNFKTRKGDPAKGIAPVPGHPGDPVEMLSMHDRAISPEDVKAWIAAAKRRFMVPVTLPQVQQPVVSNILVPPNPNTPAFSLALIEQGINELIAVKANLGNPGFENIVAGAVNEARLNAPELVPAVLALIKAKLFHLPNWLSGTDEKRIASFASGNMPKDPKTLGSFIFEVQKHAPGWRSGPTVPPSAGAKANAPAAGQNVELFLVEKASKAADLIANADIPDPWGHPLVTPGVASLLSGGAGVGKGNLAIFLAGILGEAAPIAAPGAPPCKPTALDKFRPPSPTGFFGLLKEDAEGIAGARMKACQHRHGFSYDMAIFCAADCAGPFWFARQSREGTVYNPRLHEEIGKLAAEGFRVQLFDSAQLLAGDIINENGAVAELLLRLNQAARDFDVAIIALTHLSKGSERSLRDRVKGASAWIDGARVHAFMSIMEPEEITALGGNPLDPVDARRFVALELDKASNGVPGSREGFIIQTAPIDPLGLKRAPVLVPVGTLATIKADAAASTSAAAADPAVRAIVVRVVTAADAAGSPLSRSSPGHAANYGYTSAITAVAGELHIAHPDWLLTICENVAKEAIKQAATAGAIVEKSKSRREVWGVP